MIRVESEMTVQNTRIVGVLLAGGKSRRFGRPKAFAEKEGKPFYRLSLDVLLPIVDSVVLITNEELVDRFSEVKDATVVVDVEKYAGKGPLAGIYTAMALVEADWYAVIPTDVPFLEPKVYDQLFMNRKEDDQAVLPVVNGRLQPLVGFYHRSLMGNIRQLLDTGRLDMRSLINEATVSFIPFSDETPFTNINKLEEYEQFIENGLRDRDA